MSALPTAERVGPRGHWPQLDGVRAVAIAVVVAYHLGNLSGGWIGVDVFFVLSGYLITWILLSDGDPIGKLKWFWGRRLRRLLPAVVLLVLVVAVYSWAGGPGVVPAQVRAPALATLFYTANWQQIVGGHSYFARYAMPSPFQHTWSLAIEEQYYLLWPLLLGVLLILSRGPSHGRPRRPVMMATAALAAGSAAWMGLAAHMFDPNRAYLGTDTRAWELLVGGLAAMVWPPGHRVGTRSGGAPARWPSLAVLAGAGGVAAGVATAGGPPAWIWDGGLVAIALAAVALIVGAVHAPRHVLCRLLASRPLVWLGLISYSLYLWHWPTIVLMTTDTTGLSGAALLAARLAAMLSASCASYYLVERPLRTLDWRGLAGRLHVPEPAFAFAGVAAAAALIAAGTVGPHAAPSGRVGSQHFSGPTAEERLMRLDLQATTPARPYRVWILGDSVMFDSAPGVQAALESTGEARVVVNSAFPGWSPMRDKSWAADAVKTIATYHPQIVMGTWSWDAPQAAADPAGYEGYLEQMIGMLLTPGNGVQAVVLFQFPQAGPASTVSGSAATIAAWDRQTHEQWAWDTAAKRATAAFPGRALYLTTDRAFAPGGRFYTWLPTPDGSWLRARKLDNAHMCPYGAAMFGALATGDLSYYLRLPPMGRGWENAAWTRDGRYNDPPGACPDDHPPAGYDGIALPG
ncbi:MAG TPA: acyltransferase [Acidimicrobiales bacterium]|nr:acyltransferase [Acidimicrobiales bacterium]